MKAGTLRHRVTIEQPIETENPHGQPIVEWVVFASRLPMLVKELSGRELFNAQQAQPDTTLSVACRWLPGVTPKMRLIWHDVPNRTLSIEAPPLNPDGRRRELVFMCKEAR